jgi:hypothetical protein
MHMIGNMNHCNIRPSLEWSEIDCFIELNWIEPSDFIILRFESIRLRFLEKRIENLLNSQSHRVSMIGPSVLSFSGFISSMSYLLISYTIVLLSSLVLSILQHCIEWRYISAWRRPRKIQCFESSLIPLVSKRSSVMLSTFLKGK